MAPLPTGTYCKIPKDYQANVVRGARNYPCVGRARQAGGDAAGVPQQRAVRAAGHQPVVRRPEPDPDLPGARRRAAISGVDPGMVIPAPSVNNGLNPLPADQLPPPAGVAAGQRPAAAGRARVPCSAVDNSPTRASTLRHRATRPTAVYSPSSGEVVGPDGVKYTVSNSNKPGDDGWKEMLAPAG